MDSMNPLSSNYILLPVQMCGNSPVFMLVISGGSMLLFLFIFVIFCTTVIFYQ